MSFLLRVLREVKDPAMLGKKIKSPLSKTAETIVLMLAIAPAGICQTTAADENEPVSSETVEEIIVYGDKSLIQLRHELYDAEKEFFMVFNEVNSNDDFDVDCDYEIFLGSRRRHHLCIPRFAERAEAEAIVHSRSTGGGWMDSWDRNRLKHKDEQLWAEMRTLLAETPELREAMSKLSVKKLAHDAELKRRAND